MSDVVCSSSCACVCASMSMPSSSSGDSTTQLSSASSSCGREVSLALCLLLLLLPFFSLFFSRRQMLVFSGTPFFSHCMQQTHRAKHRQLRRETVTPFIGSFCFCHPLSYDYPTSSYEARIETDRDERLFCSSTSDAGVSPFHLGR